MSKVFTIAHKNKLYQCIVDSDVNICRLYIRSSSTGYKRIVYSSGEHKGEVLSRVLLNAPEGVLADHKNRNSLDCRRENLRLATHQQNASNRTKHIGKVLPKGVSKKSERYAVTISCNRTQYYIGTYDSIKLAVLAYNKKALEFFGEFANLTEVSDHE